jgi:hypothetical protein
MNRLMGWALLLLMVAANAALFTRDILPDWLVGEPPAIGYSLEDEQRQLSQMAIWNERNELVGRVWAESRRVGNYLHTSAETVIEPIRLPNGLAVPRLLSASKIAYAVETQALDSIEFSLIGLGFEVSLKGEVMPTNEFPCTWQFGPNRGSFVLKGSRVAFGEALRPFQRLSNLYVGQSWRVKLLDPFGGLLPGVGGIQGDSVIVRVAARETIEVDGRPIETFRVETASAMAWVDDQGKVLRQEVEVPLLGKLSFVEEPHDADARKHSMGIVYSSAPRNYRDGAHNPFGTED